ncbi:hypothetical protein AHAS_Ahas09G0307600 [Arachis hypogaea]
MEACCFDGIGDLLGSAIAENERVIGLRRSRGTEIRTRGRVRVTQSQRRRDLFWAWASTQFQVLLTWMLWAEILSLAPGSQVGFGPRKRSGHHHLRTSPSVSSAALGKMNLTVKAISEGGFESLYKQTFTTYPNEKLKKTFACYLSTSTGPVAGTLYLSDVHVAFCSDHPLSFTAPSGQQTWSYYKVMVPLGKIGAANPVIMRENPSEKYIQIVTVDGHDFWFMGFVNFDKANKHLSEALSNFTVPGIAVPPTSSSS